MSLGFCNHLEKFKVCQLRESEPKLGFLTKTTQRVRGYCPGQHNMICLKNNEDAANHECVTALWAVRVAMADVPVKGHSGGHREGVKGEVERIGNI